MPRGIPPPDSTRSHSKSRDQERKVFLLLRRFEACVRWYYKPCGRKGEVSGVVWCFPQYWSLAQSRRGNRWCIHHDCCGLIISWKQDGWMFRTVDIYPRTVHINPALFM
ncbi:uncharacterized protein PV06_05477 [Exophiala oligosperma]|uniref:Uncharacterized protein n=1 Tax=Exophiala oligosperma TaxID=215243 RepID=A0A0D2APJ4_9EURO|nr:uncharacterized protein PV06_05477 [Exophiala oligosperma]KIW41876.1 hypothetical protein PV06_05477 [Exophiala oligosperma]